MSVSPFDFANMANIFTEAAEAKRRIPELEAQVYQLQRERDEAQRHSQALEERIHTQNATEQELLRKLSEVSTERDTFRDQSSHHASQRDRLVSAFTAAMDMAQEDLRTIVPPPAPEVAPENPPVPAHGSSDPSASTSSGEAQGQSEGNPSVAPSTEANSVSTSVPQQDAVHGGGSSPSADPGPSGGHFFTGDPEPTPKFYPNSNMTTSSWDSWARRNGREAEITR